MTLRVLLATLFLLAQSSFAQLFCACPPATPQAAAPAASTMKCSMKAKGCTCCCGGMTGGASNGTVRGSGNCQVAPGKAVLTDQVLTVPAYQTPALAPAAFLAILPTWVEPATVQIHLVVPRIRPPDPGNQGLRAPPSR